MGWKRLWLELASCFDIAWAALPPLELLPLALGPLAPGRPRRERRSRSGHSHHQRLRERHFHVQRLRLRQACPLARSRCSPTGLALQDDRTRRQAHLKLRNHPTANASCLIVCPGAQKLKDPAKAGFLLCGSLTGRATDSSAGSAYPTPNKILELGKRARASEYVA